MNAIERRAVPRLHQRGVELVERPPGRVHLGVVLPRLGDHHQHRVRQRPAAQVQQLQHLVEGGRVAAVGRADREQPLGQVAAGIRLGGELASRARIQFRLPRTVLISPLCATSGTGGPAARTGTCWWRTGSAPGPARLRSRSSDRSGKNGSSWARGQHPLVDDGPRRTGWRSRRRSRARPACAGRTPAAPARCRRCRLRAGHEQLGQVGQHRAGAAPAGVGVDGDVPPAQHGQALGLRQLGDDRHGLLARGQVGLLFAGPFLLHGDRGGQEGQAGRVGTRGGQVEVTDLAEEGVRDLGQDARAVPGTGVATLGAAVFEVAQGGQGFGHDIVPGSAGQISDKGDATRVMLEAGIVKAGRLARLLARVSGVSGTTVYVVPRLFPAGRRHQNSCRRLVCYQMLRSGRRWPCREVRRSGSLATRKLRPHYITGRIRPKILKAVNIHWLIGVPTSRNF